MAATAAEGRVPAAGNVSGPLAVAGAGGMVLMPDEVSAAVAGCADAALAA